MMAGAGEEDVIEDAGLEGTAEDVGVEEVRIGVTGISLPGVANELLVNVEAIVVHVLESVEGVSVRTAEIEDPAARPPNGRSR